MTSTTTEEWIGLTEAAARWGLSSGGVLRNRIQRGVFPKEYLRKTGKIWLVSQTGMTIVYGQPPKLAEDI